MIAICPNPYRDINLELSCKAKELLKEAGFESVICPVFAEPGNEAIPENIEVKTLEEVASGLELAMVIGGDGTILSVSQGLHETDVPILGINLGTKGFMAGLEAHDIKQIVRAANKDYNISARMKLDVQLTHGDELIYSGSVLNDAVIHGYGDTIYLRAECDGMPITTFSGDGIILATPTGSTGYSLSAGGPIIEPEAENIIVSPICAHTICSASFVLSPERVISVTAEKLHDRKAYLSLDGRVCADINKGDVLVVKKSRHKVNMVDLGVKSFYETTFEKLT